MKKFINDFYTYDFTGISSDESDIEKDLWLSTGKEDNKEEVEQLL